MVFSAQIQTGMSAQGLVVAWVAEHAKAGRRRTSAPQRARGPQGCTVKHRGCWPGAPPGDFFTFRLGSGGPPCLLPSRRDGHNAPYRRLPPKAFGAVSRVSNPAGPRQSNALDLATLRRFGNRRYGRFGNLRYRRVSHAPGSMTVLQDRIGGKTAEKELQILGGGGKSRTAPDWSPKNNRWGKPL